MNCIDDLSTAGNTVETRLSCGALDWNGMELDLRGIGFNSSAEPYTMGAEDLNRKADALVDRYAACLDKTAHMPNESERAEAMQKLEVLYQDAMEGIAGGYAGITGSFLVRNGVDGEAPKIHDSVVSGIQSKIGGKCAGTEDVPYTWNDLNVLGQYVSALSSLEKPGNAHIYTMDESRIGLEFSMLAIKTDVLCRRVSAGMAETLQRAVKGFMESYLARMDVQLGTGRRACAAARDIKGFAALDRDAVREVYHNAMQAYEDSGDVTQALIKGAESGMIRAAAEYANGTYRYQNNAGYWTNFFRKGRNSREEPVSTLQKHLAGWRDFQKSLEDGGAVRLNLSLKTHLHYPAAESRLTFQA